MAKEFGVSTTTIRRALHGEGFYSRVALSDSDKRVRLEFCQEYLNFNWQNTIFSDQKSFHFTLDGPQRRKKDGEQCDENDVVPNKQSGKITLKVWGWMSDAGPGELVIVNHKANSNNYLDVLNNVMLPSVRTLYPADEMEVINFVDGNCPLNRAPIVKKWFAAHKDINRVPLPPKSPDLNPMENLWGLVGQMWENYNERTAEDPYQQCLHIWDELRTQNCCTNIVNSMRERLEAVIAADGGYTKFC